MMPYLYSAVRESHADRDAGDARAVAALSRRRGGGRARRSVSVGPRRAGGAGGGAGRDVAQVYLPRGAWYDFWTGERLEGGREITRPVDLETMPLYVRAGAIVPMGPVKQYTAEKVDGPLAVTVYPGADGAFLLYEDDGSSFNYRKGEWMGHADGLERRAENARGAAGRAVRRCWASANSK